MREPLQTPALVGILDRFVAALSSGDYAGADVWAAAAFAYVAGSRALPKAIHDEVRDIHGP
jgi:hypothetical protein